MNRSSLHTEALLYSDEIARRSDVCLACFAGVDVADDATIEFRKEERVEFSHIIRSKHIGIPAAAIDFLPYSTAVS